MLMEIQKVSIVLSGMSIRAMIVRNMQGPHTLYPCEWRSETFDERQVLCVSDLVQRWLRFAVLGGGNI